MVSCIPQNKIVVFAGDMNGHVGSNNAGYDGTHGGFGYGSRNADGSKILEFALEVFLNDMRYINPRFTYFTYLLTLQMG